MIAGNARDICHSKTYSMLNTCFPRPYREPIRSIIPFSTYMPRGAFPLHRHAFTGGVLKLVSKLLVHELHGSDAKQVLTVFFFFFWYPSALRLRWTYNLPYIPLSQVLVAVFFSGTYTYVQWLSMFLTDDAKPQKPTACRWRPPS